MPLETTPSTPVYVVEGPQSLRTVACILDPTKPALVGIRQNYVFPLEFLLDPENDHRVRERTTLLDLLDQSE